MLAAARTVDGDTWITKGQDNLVLVDVQKSELTAGDFVFV